MTFSELGLQTALQDGLLQEEITVPMPIQSEAVPVLLAGKDAYVSSETGTGKTLAYLLPLFNQIDSSQRTLQVLVVVPTHELAMQIYDQACRLAKNSGLPIRSQVLIGGVAVKRQVEKLKEKPHLVVGSPGRINELTAMKKLKVHTVKTVVVDEADRLLFEDSLAAVRQVIKSTLKDRRLIFVSATEQVASFKEATSMARDLVQVHVGCNQVNRAIVHCYLVCEERDKPEFLRKVLHAVNPERAMVFVHRNETAEIVAETLAYHKMAVADIHGARDKMMRKKAMNDFRSGRASVLIASDVAARGLDVREVSHVFNLDIPAQSKAYLHRVGRTARAGASGMAISLMTLQEVRLARRYERELEITMTPVRLFKGQLEEILPPGDHH